VTLHTYTTIYNFGDKTGHKYIFEIHLFKIEKYDVLAKRKTSKIGILAKVDTTFE